MKMKWSIVVPLVLIAGFAIAQAPAIKRTILQKGDVPVEGAREVIMGTAEIAAGGATGRHSHNGPETGYVQTCTFHIIQMFLFGSKVPAIPLSFYA